MIGEVVVLAMVVVLLLSILVKLGWDGRRQRRDRRRP